jgi:hypothetical protein
MTVIFPYFTKEFPVIFRNITMDSQTSQIGVGLVYIYWPKTGKQTYMRALCQKNKGSVEIKQRSIKMDGRTIYRTLSPKGTPFQTGIDG